MLKTFSILLLFSYSAMSMPNSFEVWFLSPDSKEAYLPERLLDKGVEIKKSVAQSNLQCQRMGEYCFDPQVGLYKMGGKKEILRDSDYTVIDKLEDHSDKRVAQGKEFKDTNCSGSGLFSMFCSKEKSKLKQAKLEIWIDTSSTMKQVDFEGYDQQCKRESFLRLLTTKCSFNEDAKVYIFDETKKQLGRMDRVCLNAGLNNSDRIIRDIKTSKASHLIVITDIFEASEKLINFVETTDVGLVKGIESPMFASDLKTHIPRLKKKCL
tara:strand:- start:2617 stop:3417 length:801 start_codon:yes stop_codon:yes gene_type:complete